MSNLPVLVPPAFRIIAHRGASAYVPENTLAAFQLAYEMGVTEIETDVQLTTDGVVVLCHDRTLARYGHGEQVMEEMKWDDLATLDMGSWFSPYLHHDKRMLTLDELLATFGDKLTYHLEIKGHAPQLAAATHQLIITHRLHSNCFITSFDDNWLATMQQIDPTLRLGWLVTTIDEQVIARAKALQLYQLCPCADQVTANMVAQARTVVAEVRAWGLQSERVASQARDVQALIHNLLAAGCDGMTINWPDWVRRKG